MSEFACVAKLPSWAKTTIQVALWVAAAVAAGGSAGLTMRQSGTDSSLAEKVHLLAVQQAHVEERVDAISRDCEDIIGALRRIEDLHLSNEGNR